MESKNKPKSMAMITGLKRRAQIALALSLIALLALSAVPFRVNGADGNLDLSFGTLGKVTTDFYGSIDVSRAVALQSDGKIVVAGIAFGKFGLARYNSDGTLDTSFGGDGKVTTDFSGAGADAYAVAVQSDGKIVVAGESRRPGPYVITDLALARYNSDGTLDTSFSGDGTVTTDFYGTGVQAYGVALQSDGKIVVAGYTLQATGISTDFALARYNSDGSLDDGTAADSTPADSFGSLGKVTTDLSVDDRAYAVALQGDGKIVVAGLSDLYTGTLLDFALARYNSDGTLDTSFGGDGKLTTDFSGAADYAEGVVVQSDGKIVVTGTSLQATGIDYDFALARYEGNSSAQSNINDVITGIEASSLAAGTKTSLNAKLQAALAALQAGDTATACSSLQDFLNYVRAQKGKKIPATDADALTDNVIQIRAELGCP